MHEVRQYRTPLLGVEAVSLRSVRQFPRHSHDQFGILAIKAEMHLMQGVHAVLPSEHSTYRTLALSDPANGSIDERESQVRDLNLDLSALPVESLASLSMREVLELRKAAEDYFQVMRQQIGNPQALTSFVGRSNSISGI